MKRRLVIFLLLFIILLTPVTTLGQERDNTADAGVKLISADDLGVLFELRVPQYEIKPVKSGDDVFEQISLPMNEDAVQDLTNQFPLVNVLLGVPANAIVDVEVIEDVTSSETRALELQAPLQPERISEALEPGKLTSGMDTSVSEMQLRSPGIPVEITSDAWMRDQRIVRVEMRPIQYNPPDSTLTWHKRMLIRVHFKYDHVSAPGQTSSTDMLTGGYATNPFENVLKTSLLNHESAAAFRTFPTLTETRFPNPSLLFDNGDPAYKVDVNQDGIYQLTYTDLQNAGLDVANLDPTLITMHNQGQEIAIHVENEDGDIHDFSPSERVIFYGQKFYGQRLAQLYASESSHYFQFPSQLSNGADVVWQPQFNAEMLEKYTETNAYWLSVGLTPGLRMDIVSGTPNGAQIPNYYITTVKAEQSNEWYSTNFTSEDTWYWEQISDSSTQDYSVALNDLASGPYNATVRGEIVAKIKHPFYNPDHHTRIQLNNQVSPFVDTFWDGISRLHFEEQVPNSQLVEGSNQIHLNQLWDAYTGQSTDILYFDWFEIEYRRQFRAANNEISFSRDEAGTPWEYHVSNFSDPEVTLLNITDPVNPDLVTGGGYASGVLTFGATHAGTTAYWAAGSSAINTPMSITYYQPPDLLSSSNAYDYIIITHTSLVGAAQNLATYRSGQGYSTLVVDVNDLYNLFNYGIFHSIAIKNFIAYTFSDWSSPPAYIVLAGDGHWNFKGFSGPLGYYSPPIYLPPHLGWVDPWQGEVDSANLLATVVGTDPLADVLISRIPVNSPAELNAVTDKIIAYEQGSMASWQSNLVFIADNIPDPSGDFIAETEQLINDYVEPGYVLNRIYQNAYNCTGGLCPTVNFAITDTLNTTGALFVTYTGHASINRWSHERIFTTTNIQTLNNGSKLPVVLSLTCLDGYWSHPGGSNSSISQFSASLMEDMLRAANKGAVGTFSPTGLGVATGHEELARGFYQSIFQGSVWNMGEATMAAKLRLYASGANLDLLHTFTVFGDPALRIRDPYQSSLSPTTDGTTRLPGSVVQYDLQITNHGVVPDYFSVSLSGSTWVVTAPTVVGPVAPAATAALPVTVYTSLYAPNGTTDVTQVRVTSQGDTSAIHNSTLTTTVFMTGTQYLQHLPQMVRD